MISKNIKLSYMIYILLLFTVNYINANYDIWNGKKCAIVLTYDDALNTHIDNVIPLLDSLNFKATFYVFGYSSAFRNRLNDWRKAALNGHELGNHTLFHPCAGSYKGREWVKPDYDLNKYSLQRIKDEILMNNALLEALDGNKSRTFAYPCGDMSAGDSSYVNFIKENFESARSVKSTHENLDSIDLFDIGCFVVNGQLGDELINQVKHAMQNQTLLVFLFHGVGGEHPINISLEAHKKLLKFIKENENQILIAPLRDIVKFIKNKLIHK